MLREPEGAAPRQHRWYARFDLISQDITRLKLGRGRNVLVLRSFRTVVQSVC